MSAPLDRRAHLVERAAEAFGTLGVPPGPALAMPLQDRPPQERPAQERPVPDQPAPPVADPVPAIGRDTLIAAGLVSSPDGPLRSRVLEELTLVQHQVMRSIQLRAVPGDATRNRIVLVTSARPNEGKSFTALNLAASIAIGGARQVVLIDADGRIGSLSHALGVASASGLRSLVRAQAGRAAGLPRRTAIERMRFLPYGACPEGEPDLPSGADMAAAVLRLANSLPDHILVLDTPPCLSTSDPSALAGVAGQVVLVVQAEETQRNEVEAALDMLDACPLLQLLLNQVRLTANDSFGAFGDYGVPDAT